MGCPVVVNTSFNLAGSPSSARPRTRPVLHGQRHRDAVRRQLRAPPGPAERGPCAGLQRTRSSSIDGLRPVTRVRHDAVAIAVMLVVVGIVFAALAEAAVRARQWMKAGSLGRIEDTFVIDRATGLRILRPNMVQGQLRTNSLGFRGPEIAPAKAPGTVRVAFLGASTTYCAEVNANEQTWPHLVIERVDRVTGAKFDYVNAGVPGYGYDSILKGYRLRVQPLAPDVVVIYEASNDLSADTRKLAQQAGLVGDRVIKESWLSKHSLLWFLVEKNLTIRSRQAAAVSAEKKLAPFNPKELSGGFATVFRETVATAQRGSSLVAVATFSTRMRRGQSPEEQTKAAVTSLYYMPYMTLDQLLTGFEEYNRVIRETARETGALLIEGEDRIPPDARHFTDSIHFSEAGSRVMADRISSALLASPSFKQVVAEVSRR